MSSILFAGAILAGGTGAFMGDSEISTGNTFATGVIDLKIDNESYVTNNEGKLVFSPSNSWKAKNLAGELFFDFDDLKPGDVGEDTISLHTNKEKAWSCMKVSLIETDGELQEGLYFAFWADDGDNVFETDEKIFKKGSAEEIFDGEWWTLSDSESNIWQKEGWNYSHKYEQKWNKSKACQPLGEKSVKYIGKIWCFGEMLESPLSQDGKGKIGSNGPLTRGTGWQCEGEAVGNKYQTDSISLDVSFLATMYKNNEEFVCDQNYSNSPKTKIVKKFKFPFWKFWN